jgi:exonuclease VII small subunit
MTKSNATIKDKMQELQKMIDWFNSDDFSLEQAKEKFDTAKTLASALEHTLDELKNEVTVVAQSFQE